MTHLDTSSTARAAGAAFLALAAAVFTAGCTKNSWTYNKPPNALGSEPASGLNPEHSEVVVIGEFKNPTATSLEWKDIGHGVSRALSQALLNEGDYDVWTNEGLAVAVERVLKGPTPERADKLGGLHKKNPEVRYVIVGRVTDFHHTNEVSRDLRRRAILGLKKEAIAALEFWVVDLKLRRLVLADHVHGTAPVGRESTDEVYQKIAFGSYLFWNSPLGRATEAAIRMAMARITTTVPDTMVSVRISEEIAPRKVELTGGRAAGLRAGQEWYVCRQNDVGDSLTPVTDPHTGQPLRIRIMEVEDRSAVGWIRGEPPAGTDLLSVELSQAMPGLDSAVAADDADLATATPAPQDH